MHAQECTKTKCGCWRQNLHAHFHLDVLCACLHAQIFIKFFSDGHQFTFELEPNFHKNPSNTILFLSLHILELELLDFLHPVFKPILNRLI